ncbi:MAG: TlpA family protein disulfide reductase, partial [Thermoanaerobaculia bacterium]
RWSAWLLLLVPLLGVAAGYVLRLAARQGVPAEAPAEPGELAAPLAFELTSLDGAVVRARDYAGRVVLLDVWASWCAPCRLQNEILHPLASEYGEEVSFLAVNLGEPEEVVRAHLESEPLPYRVILDPGESLGAQLGIYALPAVIILDRESRVSFFRQGLVGESMLRRELAKAAGARPS